MRTTLCVAVAAMLSACGGTDSSVGPAPGADPVIAAPDVACEQRWVQNVYTDSGTLCSYGTITVTVCRPSWPPEPPPDLCASFRY